MDSKKSMCVKRRVHIESGVRLITERREAVILMMTNNLLIDLTMLLLGVILMVVWFEIKGLNDEEEDE